MILELCGLPGVGKTTVALQLESALLATRISSPQTNTHTLRLFLRYALCHPVCLVRTLSLLPWWTQGSLVWNAYVVRIAKWQLAHDSHADSVILDEGPLQVLLSLAHVVPNWQALRALLPQSDVVLIVTAPEADRQAFLAQRQVQYPAYRAVVRPEEKETAMMALLADMISAKVGEVVPHTELYRVISETYVPKKTF